MRRLCLFVDTDSVGTESNYAIEATQVNDKRVLMRVDFNVPTPETHICTDTQRTEMQVLCLNRLEARCTLHLHTLAPRPMDKEGNITNTQRIVRSLARQENKDENHKSS